MKTTHLIARCLLLPALLITGKSQLTTAHAQGALPEDIRKSLILHFDFDSAPVDGKAADKSGHGNVGQIVNVAFVKDGHKAWRRIFDKSWDHGYDITMGGDDGAKSYQGQVMMEVAGAAAVGRGQVTDGRWHQVVGTFNAKELVFYLDGKRAGSARAKQQPAPTMFDLTIGANRSNPPEEIGPSFVGMMDDVMMFNRALSAEEVQVLFTAQGGLLEPQPASNPPGAAPAKPSAADRLKQVKQLFDQGLINKEDYDKKVKEIMDSL